MTGCQQSIPAIIMMCSCWKLDGHGLNLFFLRSASAHGCERVGGEIPPLPTR